MRGVPLQAAHEIAPKIEELIARDGFGDMIPSGIGRFDFNVLAHHEDGTQFVYYNAYCVIYEEWLFIFPEHFDVNIIHTTELSAWSMNKRASIPEVKIENGLLVAAHQPAPDNHH